MIILPDVLPLNSQLIIGLPSAVVKSVRVSATVGINNAWTSSISLGLPIERERERDEALDL